MQLPPPPLLILLEKHVRVLQDSALNPSLRQELTAGHCKGLAQRIWKLAQQQARWEASVSSTKRKRSDPDPRYYTTVVNVGAPPSSSP